MTHLHSLTGNTCRGTGSLVVDSAVWNKIRTLTRIKRGEEGWTGEACEESDKC